MSGAYPLGGFIDDEAEIINKVEHQGVLVILWLVSWLRLKLLHDDLHVGFLVYLDPLGKCALDHEPLKLKVIAEELIEQLE